MTLLIAGIPYFIICLLVIVGLDKVSVLKWTWDNPPSYIRAIVGVLWPVWALLMLIYAATRKRNKQT